MLFIQLTGLPGSGKSTIANGVKELLRSGGFRVELIDGDVTGMNDSIVNGRSGPCY
jgi:adenylylsulfate kinase